MSGGWPAEASSAVSALLRPPTVHEKIFPHELWVGDSPLPLPLTHRSWGTHLMGGGPKRWAELNFPTVTN